ncbi:hypothetical protein [Kitasatospora fiedleri]|uniref:hypothetical protein n=1 Tax=Kitasatospora fiedleri TaxID=2991545 RepID=UPI00384AD547
MELDGGAGLPVGAAAEQLGVHGEERLDGIGEAGPPVEDLVASGGHGPLALGADLGGGDGDLAGAAERLLRVPSRGDDLLDEFVAGVPVLLHPDVELHQRQRVLARLGQHVEAGEDLAVYPRRAAARAV